MELSSDLPNVKKVAILGLRRAGKSTFLAVLSRALDDIDSPWTIAPKDEDAIKNMNYYRDMLFNKRLYPPNTPESGPTRVLRFTVYRERGRLGIRSGGMYELEVADVPGGAMRGIFGPAEHQKFYEEYVEGRAGIIFLLDPQQKWKEGEPLSGDSYADPYYPLFSSIVEQIRLQFAPYEPVIQNVYVAFCVTKLDTIYDQPKHRKADKMFADEGICEATEKHAEDILGPKTKRYIDRYFKNVRWMPVSATGYTKDREVQFEERYEDGTNKAGIRDPVNLSPIGVAEAVEWILDQIAEDNARAWNGTNRLRGAARPDGVIRSLLRRIGLE